VISASRIVVLKSTGRLFEAGAADEIYAPDRGILSKVVDRPWSFVKSISQNVRSFDTVAESKFTIREKISAA